MEYSCVLKKYLWFISLIFIFFTMFNINFTYSNASKENQKILLMWENIPDAVMYEIRITSREIDHNSLEPGSLLPRAVFVKKNIFTPGLEINSASFKVPLNDLWWQIRAFDTNYNPISDFTKPKKIIDNYIISSAPKHLYDLDTKPYCLLYPVYSWIPVLGATSYEIEILRTNLAPEENSTFSNLVRKYKVNGSISFNFYDEESYTKAETLWWRIRALDRENTYIGNWSKCSSFTIQTENINFAALGDSITHGGGAISNSPPEPLYDWTAHTNINIKNLAKSGNTSLDLVKRFDKDVLPFSPKVLIIMIGVNDIREGNSATEVISNLEIIRSKCNNNKIIPVFVTTTPINPELIIKVSGNNTSPSWQAEQNKINTWILSQKYSININHLLIDENGILKEFLASDGLHIDSEGKKLIGETIGNYLKNTFPELI